MCLRKRGVIPKSWYPHQSCTTDVITVGHTQAGYMTWRTLRVTAGTTGKIHKHTKCTGQRVLPSSQECDTLLIANLPISLALNNSLLSKCQVFHFNECYWERCLSCSQQCVFFFNWVKVCERVGECMWNWMCEVQNLNNLYFDLNYSVGLRLYWKSCKFAT